MANKDVFISYKAEEIEEASWVKSVLESNGISCWMAPSCIPGGSSYAVEIPQAIRQAKVFVLILSSKAQSSQWVSREVDLAINEGKIVLPFMLENCALKDDFNFYLTNVQRYAAYENKLAAAEKMINEIKALVGHSTAENEVKAPVGHSTAENEVKEPLVENPIASSTAPITNTVAKPKYETKSILSLVFGIIAMVAMLGMFLVPNIIAIILSILSLKTIRQENKSGKGLAIAGQVLGLVSMAIGLSIWFSGIGFAIALIIDIVSLIFFIKQYKLIKKA